MTKQRSSTPLSVKDSVTKVNVVEGVLQNYLDQLLITATQEPQKVEKIINIPDEVLDSAIGSENLNNNDIVVELVTSTDAGIDLDIGLDVDVVASQVKPLTDQESWSSQGVECLVFSVCGLKLAVPLLFLGGVHKVRPDEVKPLMGQPAWYLGMVHTDECNLQAIDTANFIMPERAQYLSEQGFKYLIQLEKTPWAIACQSIDDTVRLEAVGIKWRGERGKRTWLAGTVIEEMCALVDVAGLLQVLELNCKRG